MMGQVTGAVAPGYRYVAVDQPVAIVAEASGALC